jgi:VIT1/CCC1 family predicted Fe2+/Mn2+ transporter
LSPERDRDGEQPRRPDPPRRPPSLSTPTDQKWSPFGTGVAVFTAVAIPIVTVGYMKEGALDATYTLIGIVLGLLAGVIAGLWVGSRGGRVWRGPRL